MDEAQTNGTPAAKPKKVTPKSAQEAEIRMLIRNAQARHDAAKEARAKAEHEVRDALKDIAALKDQLLELLTN